MTTILVIALLVGGFFVGMNLWTRRLTRQGLKRVPQPGQIVPVRGGSIHYVEKGDPTKQTVIMIHGLAGQLQHFTYSLMDLLADDYHVIAVDRPGCGYSTRDSADLGRLPEQARMIQEFLDTKGISNAVLVGHSLGGAVSLAMALEHPEKTKALALLAPLTQKLSNTPQVFKPLEIRTEWLRNFIGNTIAVPISAKTAPHTLGAVFYPEPAPDDFLDRAGGALGLRPSAFVTASQDVVGVDESIGAQVDRYTDLSVPGGILYGAQDTILSPTANGAPMTRFGLSDEKIEGLGHMIPITAPDACAAFIRRIADTAGVAAQRATKAD
ncbi:alpha/beta fold hydrolase [Ruegeria atlantica]|uniref:Dihydrolipoyllysine-residue acetyltransferase component of acetoin cleaving system n=1 Tax=Ruegeria atlantica TaxID=81569 RepID=A0A0P1EGI8_9RHOB|nr:alpha/beta hydrolase [Ruegeria atlantica]CUH48963.1 Dihydrolipoyllysine-residue acetyltransferase component of acetoin cleaving system [Ruegeria atlantica]